MTRSRFISLLLLASLVLATSVTAAGAADGPGEIPLALRGELVWDDVSESFGGGSGFSTEDVMVEVAVWPRDEVLAAMSPGDAVPLEFVEAPLVLEGDEFEVRLDPDAVPAGSLNHDGRVTVELLVHAYGEELGGTIETVAGFTDGDGDTHWVDPIEVERLTESTTLEPADVVVTTEAVVEPPDGLGGGGDLMDCGSLRWVLETKQVFHTWIGNTYPVGGDTARMLYSSSHTASYGIAVTSGGGWSASGSKSITSGWQNEWTNSSSNRHYRVNAEYGRYRREWSRCGATGTKRWMVISETGGTGTASDTTPSWTKCENVSSGTWRRNSSSGTAYSMGAGVRSSSTIGINLSISSQYGSSRQLIYNVSSGKKMCGSGGNWPAVAARVQEKHR